MTTQNSGLVSLGTNDSQTLLLRGQRLSRQSLFFWSASEDKMRMSQGYLASALGPIIRQKLRNGCLPSIRPARIFGGPGAGGHCAACNRDLRATQLVMELPCDGRVMLVHGDCFIIWDAERRRRGRIIAVSG
jgi:hypothetical protein